MIDLIRIKKITDDLIQEFRLTKEDELYECCIEGKKIGYAIIRNKINDRIFLIISTEYQNMGYGSIIFESLLFKINEPIICAVPFQNIKMQRIIQKNNGIEIGRNKEMIQYIIENIK